MPGASTHRTSSRTGACVPRPFDPLPGFADAVARDRLAAWIADLPPPYAGYDGLRRGLATYRKIAADGGWQQMPAGPDLTMGSTGTRVAALRKRLRVEDSSVAETGPYDRALLDAVRRAQRRYGLNPTGITASQTLAALNVPVEQRIARSWRTWSAGAGCRSSWRAIASRSTSPPPFSPCSTAMRRSPR
jgi:murein L,D-transpeptidase YcbB/YkuD